MIVTNKCLKSKFYLLFILTPFLTLAQVELKGRVIDETGAVPYANVVLSDENGQIISGAITAEDGNFEIITSNGNYHLSITFVGYENHETEVSLISNMNIGDVVLSSRVDTLDEIVVSGNRIVIERKIDRLVFNIENNVATAGGTAMDALKISPGIATSENTITMIGKSGMRVMVDDKIIPLAGEELTSFLTAIPADDIKEIEIITNPPARYEADGNSGLINIIYKKGVNNAWRNSTSLFYTQAIFSKYDFRNSFNYKKDRINLLLSINGTVGNTYVRRFSELFYPDGKWTDTRRENWNNDNFSGRFMIDYDIATNSTIGIQYLTSISDRDPGQQANTFSSIFNDSNTIDSLLISSAKSDIGKDSHSLNAYFKTKLDTLGRSVSINLDYFNDATISTRVVETDSYLENNDLIGRIFSNKTDSDQILKNYSARVDVEHPLPGANLSYGSKITFTSSNYKIVNQNTISETPVFDPNLSDDFEYIENVQALYVNGSREINEKWETQLGFRLENTQTKGISETLNQTNKNDYLRLFPSFYLTYKLNTNNVFSINYGRRISRPLYYQLNPARSYSSLTTFSEGNPLLLPSNVDNFELTHTYKKKFSTKLFLSVESDGYGEISDINPETNEVFYKQQNFFNQSNYGLSLFYSFDTVNWWQSQTSLYFLNSQSNFFTQDNIIARAQNGFRSYAISNNTFSLNKEKTIRGQLNYWYSTPFRRGLFSYGQTQNLDAVLNFKMLKENLQISMGVYDIFNSSPRETTSVTNGIRKVQTNFWSNRQFRLSLIYNTGNKKIKVNRRGFGNDEEKRRSGQ